MKSRLATASTELGETLVKPSSARDHAAVGVEVHAGQRAGAERHDAAGGLDGGEAIAVARGHPEPGEQVMGEVDRLRALQVGVAGQRPVEVALGGVDERRHVGAELRLGAARRLAREERDVGDDLVVARAGGVQRAAGAPGDRRQPPLDGHVDVLVVGLERERAVAQLALDLVEARQDRVAVVGADDPLGGEHLGVRARLRDVMGPQPLVEAQRRVHLPEGRVLRFGEARHVARQSTSGPRESAIWATWVASAKPSR